MLAPTLPVPDSPRQALTLFPWGSWSPVSSQQPKSCRAQPGCTFSPTNGKQGQQEAGWS